MEPWGKKWRKKGVKVVVREVDVWEVGAKSSICRL